MINKLCLVLGIVPILILYIVKCVENKYWITIPLAIGISIVIGLSTIFTLVYIFAHIGWLPK